MRNVKRILIGLVALSACAVVVVWGISAAPGIIERLKSEVSGIEPPSGSAGAVRAAESLADSPQSIVGRVAQVVSVVAGSENLLSAEELYRQSIEAHVQGYWTPPAGAPTTVRCVVYIEQTTTGHVQGADVRNCDGSPGSIVPVARAVLRSSPLPLPNDYSVFSREREITLTLTERR